MNWKTGILIVSASLIGCSETFENPIDKPILSVQRVEIGKFDVTIELPEDYSPHIYRDSFIEKNHFVSSNQSGFINDTEVKPGELYTYRFGYVNNGNFIEQQKAEIQIPLDVLSSQFEKLPNHYFNTASQKVGESTLIIENLVLEKGFPFSLSGTRSQVVVKNLISIEGSITSFLPTEEAPVGENGSSGGPLKIQILSGEGDFTLTMRGQKGGRGIEPKPLGEYARGKTGKKGLPGLYRCVVSIGEICTCVTVPGDGEKGGKSSHSGNSGSRGFRGGNSGELFLEVSKNANVNFEILREPGEGGFGSLGGLGGPGGFGGPPGDVHVQSLDHTGPGGVLRKECPAANTGPLGDYGDRGPSGAEGDVGKLEKTCTRITGDTFWKCEN